MKYLHISFEIYLRNTKNEHLKEPSKTLDGILKNHQGTPLRNPNKELYATQGKKKPLGTIGNAKESYLND